MTDTAPNHSVLSFDEPQGLNSRGTLVVIPGRGEQPAVYRRFGQRLANDAYRVRVVADPTREADLATRQIEEVVAHSPSPVVLVGSDTGALFAAALAAEDRVPSAAGLILAGLPSAEAAPAPAESWDAELDARTTCPTHRGRISDSLVTPGAIYEEVPSDLLERASFEQIEQPILALHGREDPISSPERARESVSAAAHAEFVSIAGARHDVLNDQTHRTVAATAVLWLERLRAGNDLALIAHAEPVGANVA